MTSADQDSATAADMLEWLNANTRQGVFTTDRRLRITSWNKWLEEHSKRRAGDLIGKSLSLALPELERRNLLASYEAALTGSSHVLAQSFHGFFIEMPPGAWHGQLAQMQQSATITPLFRGASIVGTVTVIEDVSERVAQEQALRASEERFRLIATAASDCVWDWHISRGKIWSLDPMSGQAGRELDADEWWPLTAHTDDIGAARQSLAAALAGPHTIWTHEHRAPAVDSEERFVLNRGWIVRSASGRAERVLGAAIDLTESRKREEHIKFLLRELSHRSKNLLAVIQSMSSQTARTTTDLEDHQRRFLSRLQALSASHELLVSNEWQGAPLDILLARMLEPFTDDKARFRISGPPVRLQPQAAQSIGLAVHELATNAVKYGALSIEGGAVEIAWSIDSTKFSMSWSEKDGPPVAPPKRTGFGHVVIERLAAQSLGGSVDLGFHRQGLVWRLESDAHRVLT